MVPLLPLSQPESRVSILRSIRRAGVLGINRRNIGYVGRYNPRELYPRVDDKLETKRICVQNDLRTPELYGTVEAYGELRDRLPGIIGDRREFVIKPAHGAMGSGVLVIIDQRDGRFVRSNGQLMDWKDLRYHVSGILSGLHSLGGRADCALVEYRVGVHPAFESLTAGGVPDCRIIVCRGVPVMAMLRLPTQESGGRANLHQGAIAAGVDIATGRTHRAILHDRVVTEHPDTGREIAGLEVPCWDEVLQLATVSADLVQLGYLGVDIVLDPEQGPMILELNARPGLSIQLANGIGLLPRLRRVDAMDVHSLSIDQRVAKAKELSGV